jgi:hypothetical protein
VNQVGKPVLVPPRPNLGPEPMPERWTSIGWGLGLLGLLVTASLLARRLRRRSSSRSVHPDRLVAAAGPFDNRRQQMAAWSDAVRAALISRFGAAWGARTTEEIAESADTTLLPAIGVETSSRLVTFFIEADRAKFDDLQGIQPPLPGGPPEWLVTFLASSPSPSPPRPAGPAEADGARSRIKGK